ncbi:GspE/PulE family protein [Candidatus Omnitrophota bacterium]
MKTLKEKIIDIILEKKKIKKEELDSAIKAQKQKGISLEKVLIEKGLISEKELIGILAKELNIPPINLAKYKIDPEVLDLIPERVCRQYRIVPLSKIGTTLTLVTADPLNIFALDDIKNLTGYDIDIAMCAEQEILNSIDKYYHSEEESVSDVLKHLDDKDAGDMITVDEFAEQIEIGATIERSGDAPIVQVVNLIIREALKQRASDIHVEPTEKDLRIRYRIDGVLHEAMSLPKKNQNAIIARFKIMTRLDITEWRLPQDGRFKIRNNEKEIDFRVSVLPITYGQKIVLRLLDKANLAIGLDGLGFFPETTTMFKDAIASPFGMILVTGPTGSGKSTTLYSIVNSLNQVERNIITVEDPVEYQIDGITQIHVKPEIGLTFASGLRSLLRQNPDIIMIGEIRDSETADIAVKSALTGTLVFSTLHTNDAAGAITRLVDMGVEPFLVASSTIMTCAQRLCRKICERCKTQIKIPAETLERAGIKPQKDVVYYYGKGCSQCRNTGYKGRMGLLEVLLLDDAIREMIVNRASLVDIKNYAIKEQGMTTLWDDAVKKFSLGLTTFEEVLRVTSEE